MIPSFVKDIKNKLNFRQIVNSDVDVGDLDYEN